jgi:DNA primase
MAFPEGFLEDVRRAADIVRTISEHVTLKKMGSSWKGLCPFHHEKTPSFNVRSEPAVFHCFGCGEGGDVFKFVMLHEKVGFPEAVETLARRFGVPVPETRFEAGPDRKEREAVLELLDQAARHFTRNLWGAPGTRAREYLLGRGFRRETLEKIRAGAAADAWDDLLRALSPRFSPATLQTAGLVLPKQNGQGHYDRFRNRAVFPILNEGGRVVGFGARSLDGSEPKYLNSPENPVYHKGRTVYGLSWAREPIRQSGRVVLMEGYLDVARALEGGVGEVVATCGTALTSSQARLLRRFTERAIVNFDQDAAGQKAAQRSIEILLEEGLRVQVVELPEGHDPDTYLKAEGAEAYRRRLDEAPEYMEWLIRKAARDHDTRRPAGKAGYFAALAPLLSKVPSPVERSAWMKVAVERGGLDPRAAMEELRAAMTGRPAAVAETRAPAPPRTILLPAERHLVALLVAGANGAGEAVSSLEEDDLAGLATAEVLRAARRLIGRGDSPGVAALADELGDDNGRLLTEVAVQGAPSVGLTADDCVRELKRRPLVARMAEIQRALPAASGEAQEALLSEKQRITRQMASL